MTTAEEHWHVYIAMVDGNGHRMKYPPPVNTRHTSKEAARQYRRRRFQPLHGRLYTTYEQRCQNPETCTYGVNAGEEKEDEDDETTEVG